MADVTVAPVPQKLGLGLAHSGSIEGVRPERQRTRLRQPSIEDRDPQIRVEYISLRQFDAPLWRRLAAQDRVGGAQSGHLPHDTQEGEASDFTDLLPSRQQAQEAELAGEEDTLEIRNETEILKVCLERREDEPIARPLARVKNNLEGQRPRAHREPADTVLGLERRDSLNRRKMPGARRVLPPARHLVGQPVEGRPAAGHEQLGGHRLLGLAAAAALVRPNRTCPAADRSKAGRPQEARGIVALGVVLGVQGDGGYRFAVRTGLVRKRVERRGRVREHRLETPLCLLEAVRRLLRSATAADLDLSGETLTEAEKIVALLGHSNRSPPAATDCKCLRMVSRLTPVIALTRRCETTPSTAKDTANWRRRAPFSDFTRSWRMRSRAVSTLHTIERGHPSGQARGLKRIAEGRSGQSAAENGRPRGNRVEIEVIAEDRGDYLRLRQGELDDDLEPAATRPDRGASHGSSRPGAGSSAAIRRSPATAP